ncbi:recombinase family protein [Photobacterium leiognathi]|uniref:hypothetical protein n=1 Tax=Photobacterium leiognathi TaxID=553611 RepID=UPI002981FDB2|nr:hypothetical protein [Photobacterium leiognathi]
MEKGLVIVVADLPMKHAVFSAGEQNSITLALTEFMLDLAQLWPVMIMKPVINAKRKALQKPKWKESTVVAM